MDTKIPVKLSENTQKCIKTVCNDQSLDLTFFTKGENANLFLSNGTNLTEVLALMKNERAKGNNEYAPAFTETRKACSRAHGREHIDTITQMAEIEKNVQARMSAHKRSKYADMSFEEIKAEACSIKFEPTPFAEIKGNKQEPEASPEIEEDEMEL